MNIELMKSAYDKHLNLKLAAQEIGMKWQTLYWHLKKENHPISGNKSKYGSDSDKFAAKAEAEFKKMIPSAVDMNKKAFQNKYDFDVNGLKIDIKASNPKKSKSYHKATRWAFSVKRQEMAADFIVGMAYLDKKLFKLFLLPKEAIRHYQTISISVTNKSKWDDYEISKSDLIEFFTQTIN